MKLRIIFAAALIAMIGCSEDQADLVRVESEQEANQIIVTLHKSKKIAADKKATIEQRKTAWQITVPRQFLASARVCLAENNLPRDTRGGWKSIVDSSTLTPSRTTDRARYIFALSEEISKAIEAHPNVISANIILDLPDVSLSGYVSPGASSRPTAGVTLRISCKLEDFNKSFVTDEKNTADIDKELATKKIASLVAGSIGGLTPENVSVFIFEAESARKTSKEIDDDRADDLIRWKSQLEKNGEQFDRSIFVMYISLGANAVLVALLSYLVIAKRGRRAPAAAAPKLAPAK